MVINMRMNGFPSNVSFVNIIACISVGMKSNPLLIQVELYLCVNDILRENLSRKHECYLAKILMYKGLSF